MGHLLADEFTRLSAGRFSFSSILTSYFSNFFLWHACLLMPDFHSAGFARSERNIRSPCDFPPSASCVDSICLPMRRNAPFSVISRTNGCIRYSRNSAHAYKGRPLVSDPDCHPLAISSQRKPCLTRLRRCYH